MGLCGFMGLKVVLCSFKCGFMCLKVVLCD